MKIEFSPILESTPDAIGEVKNGILFLSPLFLEFVSASGATTVELLFEALDGNRHLAQDKLGWTPEQVEQAIASLKTILKQHVPTFLDFNMVDPRTFRFGVGSRTG